jgi:hypothetical protein
MQGENTRNENAHSAGTEWTKEGGNTTRKVAVFPPAATAPAPTACVYFDKDEIKRRLSVPELLRHFGVEAGKGAICCPLPGHDDKNASFCITDNGTKFKCFGCGAGKGDVLALHSYLNGGNGRAQYADIAACASIAGIVGPTVPTPSHAIARPAPVTSAEVRPSRIYKSPETAERAYAWRINSDARTDGEPEGWHAVKSWAYRWADGTEAGRVVRFENGTTNEKTGKPDKTLRPLAKVAGGWTRRKPDGGFPLYHLPELNAAPDSSLVFVCEGEKATDALVGLELVATTAAFGSSSAGNADWSPLAGRRVVIVPDNDESGNRYAETVTRALLGLDPPTTPFLLDLPDLPEKGDAVEWVAACRAEGMDDGTIRARITRIRTNGSTWRMG